MGRRMTIIKIISINPVPPKKDPPHGFVVVFSHAGEDAAAALADGFTPEKTLSSDIVMTPF